MQTPETLEAVEQALCELAQLIPSLTDPESAQSVQALTQILHLEQISQEWTLLAPEAADAFGWAAALLYKQQRYAEAERLWWRALAIQERTLGSGTPVVSATMHNLALARSWLGNYGEAEQLLHRVIAARTRSLGPLHPETILSLYDLGSVYIQQGNARAAEATYQKAVTLCERAQELESPLAIAIQSDLLLLFMAQAQWEQARPLLERVCAFYERTVGPEHPETLQYQQKLATIYSTCGQWEQALRLFQRVSQGYERVLGPGQLETARAIHQLAMVYLAREQWAEAEPHLQRALAIYEQAEGKEHPGCIECLEQLLILYLQQDQHEQAGVVACQLQSLREAQVAQVETLDLEAAIQLNNLAGIYLGQGKFAEAEPLLQRLSAFYQQMPAPDATVTATNLNALALVQARQDRPDDAEHLLRQALTMLEQSLGPEHPDWQIIHDNYLELIASLRD